MAYTELLNKIINNSGLTIKEIAEKCTEYGEKITPAYISTLRNDKNNRTPSNEVSKAIAKTCNYPYENVLCIEAYLEKSPEEFQLLLKYLKENLLYQTISIYENKPTTQDIKNLKEELENMALSEIVCSFAALQKSGKQKIIKQKGSNNIKTTFVDDELKISQQISPMGLPVNDNGMAPQIEENDLVNLEAKKIEDYKSGDIIYFNKKAGKKKSIARKIVFTGNNKKDIILMPINSEYTPEQTTISEIIILGKVTKVIKSIK